MFATLEGCRRLWNDALAHRKRRWEEERKTTSYAHQQWILTAVRHSDPELRSAYSQVAQDVLHRLDRAFKAFFERKARYPNFMKQTSSGSFTYPQAYNGSAKPDPPRKRIYLSKIGNVRAVFHRSLPRNSILKTCTVVREPCGEWYGSLVYEDVVPLQGNESLTIPHSGAALSPIGIDLGLMALIATSEGEEVPRPRFLRKAGRRLKRLQKSLSSKRKGSENRWKARKRVASLHSKVARQRADFNHKLSRKFVRDHDLVAFEDLRIRNMVRSHSFAKSIQDACWGQLISFTSYKAAKNGSRVVKVEPAYTTQECFFCTTLNRVSLEMRKFACRGCGRFLQRDINAARNVLKRALAQVGQGMPELKPAETRPLPLLTTGAASQVVEAGTKAPVR